MGKRKPENEVTPPEGGVRFEHAGVAVYIYPDGRIWSVANAKFFKASPRRRDGYRTIIFGMLSPERKSFYVHHLVLDAFGPPRPEGTVARHGPNGAHDNSIDNLSWGTVQQNVRDQSDHGTAPLIVGTHNRAKLKLEDVRQIIAGSYLQPFRQYCDEAAATYGVTPRSIEHILNGRTWKCANIPKP